MSDIFEETEETLRAEQWTRIAKKAAPWAAGAAGLALSIALGVWGYQTWQGKISETASETFQAALDGDAAVAKAKFEEVAKNGTPAYKAMALMELAGTAVTDGKIDEAIKYLDQAAKVSGDPRISDLAALKAAYLVMDKGSFADVETRLKPLTDEKRPFTFLAREALALAKLQKGDAAAARADLNGLSFALGAPEGIKQRAQLYVEAIDSGAANTIKGVMALPQAELPAAPVGQMQGLPVQPQ